MQIHELFEQDVARPIEGVIKADDGRNLETELREYVVTSDVRKGLDDLADRYLNETTANGVWISGFFGSGKSHLLKILSLVLDTEVRVAGHRPSDILLPKIEDALTRGAVERAARVPSRSILFNIDQTFDGVGGDHAAPILEVFVKVMNDLQGYYGKQGYIAQLEHDLATHGHFDGFKATYLAVNGRTWENDRPAIATAHKVSFGKAYAKHFGVPDDEAYTTLRQVRDTYKVSIESFAHRVKEYIDAQPPGFRLNFFVDEVGQFIGQDSKRMLNLQTVAETLATVCRGRAWVFVTSQADLNSILGSFRSVEAEDISKIKGRFKTQLTLASADVQEVIQKRLLKKKEDEPEVLTAIFDREKDNLATMFRFSEDSVQYKSWRGSDQFCAFYPFNPYQLTLFQTAIMQLSGHDQFTGKYLSVGERSMLAVFQDVAKAVRFQDVGKLASFDLMYDGIAPSLRGDAQTSIKLAERNLDSALGIRVLKALFLLKWVREFKATPRNVAILLIDAPGLNIKTHQTAVAEALAQLESQSYLQRNGEVFEFLTDKEKDVEKEIKGTPIDEAQVTGEMASVLFKDILRDPKVRYDANGQDYAYARRIDDVLDGRDAEMGINIITTEHPNHAHATILASQNTGKAELLVVLPADDTLVRATQLYLKTQKYVQQNTGGGDESRKVILQQRAEQNAKRREEMRLLAADLLGRAPIYLNGAPLESVGQGEPRQRFQKALQSLIAFTYQNLAMLKGSYDDATVVKALSEQNDLLQSGTQPLAEAEQELFDYVSRNQQNGDRTSAEEIVRFFGKRPYGWGLYAVLTLLARLYRMNKVELRAPDVLDTAAVLAQLRNERQRPNIKVRLQEVFDPTKVNALKRFHFEFFDKNNTGTDARTVGQVTLDGFRTEAAALAALAAQAGAYPFLGDLKPVAERVQKLSQKDHAYLLNQLADFKDELLDAKDELIAPIKAFMNGAQKTTYDEAVGFLRTEEANLAAVSEAELQPIRALATAKAPYRGCVVPDAKAAVAQVRATLAALLQTERDTATAELDGYQAKIEQMPEFAKLDESQRTRVLAKTEATRTTLTAAKFLSSIRDTLRTYAEHHYPAQLSLACQLATPPPQRAIDVATGGGVGTGTGGGGIGIGGGDRVPDPPKPMPILHIRMSALKVPFAGHAITNDAELEQYLTALRATIQTELKKGNRVTP